MFWTLLLVVLCIIMIATYGKNCSNCIECGGRLLTCTLIYTAAMLGHLICLIRNYVILFTLFGSLKQSKKFSNKQTAIFNPLVLILIGFGMYAVKETYNRLEQCEEEKPLLLKIFKEIDFLFIAGVVISGFYFFGSLVITGLLLGVKNFTVEPNQVSSDEDDEN